MSGSVLHPPLKWAQRKGSLYFTIAVSDLKVETLELTEKKLVFKCVRASPGVVSTLQKPHLIECSSVYVHILTFVITQRHL